MSSLVQYVVVRGDLAQALKWPLGAVVAQACHACTAVAFMFHDDPNTRAYAADLDRMHKVVLEVSKQCSSDGLNLILHKLIENSYLI